MKIPIHREGWPAISIFAGLNALLFLFTGPFGVLGLPLTIWCVWFFRDPERVTPDGEGLVISPADGRVLAHVVAPPPAELGMGDTPLTRISIFMNVFNVHVNRNPCEGTVMALAYRPGKFFNASFDKASEHNERMAAHIRTQVPNGAEVDIAVVQIAGLVARRIKCDLVDGQQVTRGARYGIIRFGSRLDVYLPQGITPLVNEGQHVNGGETVLADLTNEIGTIREPIS
ncbi:MAG: phosphatidylserine decarboxylase [Alphaproteobacteria bacterium]|nr:phosphatidylserine decarboxylase [Alphaproteobacteria bacterium]